MINSKIKTEKIDISFSILILSDFNNRDETIQVVPSRILWLWSPRADHA